MNKKGTLPIVILLVAAGLLIVVGVGYWAVEKAKAPEQPQLLGGDRDAHGCIGSAGYSWCEAKQKCLQVWEEECETASSSIPAVR